MAEASGVSLHIEFEKIPFVAGARKYAALGTFPGGAFDNQHQFSPSVQFDPRIDEQGQMLLFDPQTSGGLLLGVPPSKLEAFLARARELSQLPGRSAVRPVPASYPPETAR
jgi:selenide,water dikinase